jgi:hypothetical protein
MRAIQQARPISAVPALPPPESGGAPRRRNFVDLFTPAELDKLATLNERIVHHLATDDDSPAEDEPS